jgi:hypothetical protein
MNWDAAGVIAEWLGVIVVVISLGYVSLQIRLNTRTVRAATEPETDRMWTEFHARTAHSPDMVDIWDMGLTSPDDLTPTQKRRFIWFVGEYFSIVENLYRQREMGLVSDELWSQHAATVAGLLAYPLVDSWWASGITPMSPTFKATIDQARTDVGAAAWKYSQASEI